VGLSGAILVQLYHTFFNAKPSSFILILAILPSSLSLILMYFIDIFPRTNVGAYDKKFLDAFSLIALCIAGYLMLVIIGQNLFTDIPFNVQLPIFAVLVVLIGSLLAIVMKADKESKTPHEIVPAESEALMEDENNYDKVEASGTLWKRYVL
jgi:F0F1-type ATP synthase assembly protein I